MVMGLRQVLSMEKEHKLHDLLDPLRVSGAPAFSRAEGAAYFAEDGSRAVELNEMRVILGQCNRAFNRAVEAALEEVTSSRAVPAAKQELLERLDATTGGRFQAVHLTSSGSEATEAAIRMARKLTGRTEVITFWNSIHGRTWLTGSVSGVPKRKAGYGPLAPGGVFFPYPHCAKCLLKKEPAGCQLACLELCRAIYRESSAQDAAAVLVELCQGNGVVMPPPGYMRALQDWAHSQGMLFIVDENQSGLGRCGEMYLYEREGLEPDMLLLGKTLGNGVHIAALLTRQAPPENLLGIFSGGSGDDPLACRAACEVLRQLEEGLLEHIREVGGILHRGLKPLEQSPLVLEVRGAGLAAAVEFHSEPVCRRICDRLVRRGYLPGRSGSTLFCKPPYVITGEQTAGFLAELTEAVAQEETR